MNKTQRIVIAGDIHGCFRALDQAIKYFEPDLVLQCGDFGIWPWTDMDKIAEGFRTTDGRVVPAHFCDGNHEHHQTLRMFRECTSPPFEVGREVFYQPRGSTITLPNGRIVLFAGGAYSVDKDQRTPGTDWFPEEILTEDDFASFPNIPSVYMVISHAAPMSAALPPDLFPQVPGPIPEGTGQGVAALLAEAVVLRPLPCPFQPEAGGVRVSRPGLRP